MFSSRILLLPLAACAVLTAQESINNASIAGRVTDPSGEAITATTVTARDTDTNVTATVTTGADGRFRFPYLKVGPYELKAHKTGFADATRDLTLTIGSAFDVPFSLAIAASETTVNVTENSTVLEAARSQIAGTVTQKEIAELPLNGRSFFDAALLVPGVSPTNTASNQLFAETGAAPGQGISIGSQRNFSNSVIVDGLSDNDDASGLTGALYGLDTVEQLQVVTSGGQAEFGRALGGYVNLVTKSGTNTLHGDAYGFLRNTALNASNALLHSALPMTQAQYGASLGGPVVHDRTFYFANFEQRELNQSGLVTIAPANVAAINARLAGLGYPGSQVATGIYPNPVHITNFLGKVDHHFSEKDQLTARYSLYHVTSLNSRGAGGLNAATSSANLDDTDQVVAVSNVYSVSSRAVNESRGEFWYSGLDAMPSDPVGPAVAISGVATFGTLSGSPTGRHNKLAQVVDNFSYQAGPHALRAGVEYIYNDDTIDYPRSYRGSYSFSSLANFLSGAYNNLGFTQTFNTSRVDQTNPNVGLYAQDEWKVSNALTLNLGVRYDLQFLQTIHTDTDNVSPRAGFAWTPFRSRKTIVRGGYGLFYDRVPLRALANAILSANNTIDPANLAQISVSLSPTQAGAPVFPATLSSLTLPAGVLFNFSTMDPHMQNAYSEQGNLEIEQQLGAATTISAGYQHVRGEHLIISVNQNVPTCAASGTNNGCRPNPLIANDSQYSSLADSHYDALQLSFVQRPSGWSNYRISYTYSKALDNVGEFFFSSPIDNFDIWRDYGRSDDDQRHRLTMDGSIHTPLAGGRTAWEKLSHGFSLNAMFQYYSPLPFNITTGATTVQGTAARPTVNGVFINRNAGDGFDFLTLGARLSRTFALTERLRMTALAEGFNLTNHVNGVSLNGNFGTGAYPSAPSSNFRQVTAVGDPRGFQFGLRFAF
ncbi:MAG TPA: TonB-dependent receptor [Bryobacteraceae bacterium]